MILQRRSKQVIREKGEVFFLELGKDTKIYHFWEEFSSWDPCEAEILFWVCGRFAIRGADEALQLLL